MSKIRLKYDIIAQRAVDTESGVNIDEALRRRKVEIQNISNSLNQTNYEVQELGETVTSAAAIAASMEGRLSAVEDDVDDLTNEKMDKSSSADFYPRYDNPEGYLTSASMDQYATKEYVEENTSAFLTSADLSNYATTEYVDSKTSAFITSASLDPYAEKTYVDEGLATKLDSSAMSAYAESAWVDQNFQRKDDYVTETKLDTELTNTSAWAEATFASASQLSSYATTQDLEDGLAEKLDKSESANYYPTTNPSAFIDATYLNGYATEEYVQSQTSGLQPSGNYATQEWVGEQGYLTEVPSDYAQSAWVAANFASASQLSDYYLASNPDHFVTSGELSTVSSQIVSQIPSLEGYATSAWVEEQGYLTEIPSEYVTETEMGTAIEAATSGKADKSEIPDVSDFVTQEDIDKATSGKMEKSQSADFYPMATNPSGYLTEHQDLTDYATKQYVTDNTSAFITSSYLDPYAKTSELAAVSAEIMNEMPSIEGLAQEDWVKANFASAAQLAEKLDKTASADFYPMVGNPSGFLTSDDVAQSDWTEADSADPAYIKNKPAALSMAAGEGIQIVESNNTITFSVSGDYAERSDLDDYYPKTNPSGFLTEVPAEYVTDTELQTVLDDYGTSAWVLDQLDEKVDKVTGMGLSHEDFTSAYKDKLDHIEASANKNVQSDWTESDSASDAFIKNKPTPISMAAGNGISITEANDTVTIAVTDAIATSAWVASNFASAAQIRDMATQTYVIQETSGKLDKSESANYWPQATANAVIPAGTDASNQLVNELGLATAMADFGGFKKSTPDASGKPTETDPSTKLIYLTYVSSAASPDKYNEWIWDSAGNDYELIGDTTLDLTGYATETYVDQHTSGKIDWASSGQFYLASNPDGFIDSTALEPYAQTTYVDAGLNKKFDTSAMSAYAESAWVAANFQSAGQFVTSAGFNEAIAEYYKKNETSGAAELTAEFSKYQLEGDYVTSAGLTEKLNETSAWANETFQPVGSYATTTDLDNTSAWAKATFASASQLDDYYPTTNPSGFLTNSDLTGLATETYVQTQTSGKLDKSSSGAFYLATNPDHFVTSGELATLSAKIESDIPSLDGYATEEWVGQQGYLTSVPSEYVTDTEMGTAIETATSGKMDKSTSAQFYPRSTNPENYVTSGELSTLSAKIEGDIPSIAGLAAETWVQANFASASQISDMATQTWVGQQDFATSVQIDEIEEKIPANATSQNKLVTRSDLDAATTGAFEVVTLGPNDQPDVAYPNGKTIYLTKDSSLQVTDPYTEWIWLSGTSAFEVIGETTIDLTDYATQNYVQSQTSGKVDKVTGMGLSHVDFTSAYQNKLDSIAASAEVNVQSDWSVTNSALDSYIANKPDIIIPQVGAGVTDVPKYIMVVTAMPPAAQIDPNTIYLVQGTYIGT